MILQNKQFASALGSVRYPSMQYGIGDVLGGHRVLEQVDVGESVTIVSCNGHLRAAVVSDRTQPCTMSLVGTADAIDLDFQHLPIMYVV